MRDENSGKKHAVHEVLTESFRKATPEPTFVISLEKKLVLKHSKIRQGTPVADGKPSGLWDRILTAPLMKGWGWVFSDDIESSTLRARILLAAFLVLFVAVAAFTYRLFAPGYRYKVGDIRIYESGEAKSVPLIVPVETTLTASQPTPIPLEDAAEMLNFTFALPTWVPDGFTLASEHLYVPSGPGCCINAMWTDAQGQIILLLAHKNLDDDFRGEVHVPPGSWEEVFVSQEPAVLIEGGVGVISPSEFPLDVPLPWTKIQGINWYG